MSDKDEILRDIQALPRGGQRRVCDALAKEEASRKFREMPPEKQQVLYDSMAKLFSKLEADWRAKPENAGKQVRYGELWDDFLKRKDNGDGGAEG